MAQWSFNWTMIVAKVCQSTPKLSITVHDAARATGFSENYIRLLITRRELPHIRIGRAVRVLIADLEAFLQRHRQEATDIGSDAEQQGDAQ
jgi:excisionase family DNA binding protein